MMVFFKKVHKWVGLLIGVQVLLWLLSGLMISLLDPAKVSGAQWANNTHSPGSMQLEQLLEFDDLPADLTKAALRIDLKATRNGFVYEIVSADGISQVYAFNGLNVNMLERDAREIALQDFSGDGGITSIEAGSAPDMETRDHSGPYWRVNFSDPASTAIYISAGTGDILERRNTWWRVKDFFWMLHIMDYSGRTDFNNSLIIIIALTAIWLGISGFLLLFYSFSRHDFWFLNFIGKRAETTITLIDPALDKPLKVRLRKGSNLFIGLASHDINLPSICGGGGECGKCLVRFEPTDAPEPNKLEQGLIPKRRREGGIRLACQQEVTTSITLHVTKGTLKPISATAEGTA